MYRLTYPKLVTAGIFCAILQLPIAENPKLRIDWWRKNYEELTAQQDQRVARAREVFRKIVNIADKKPTITPRLFIVRSDGFSGPFAYAILDGWIILSESALEVCYKHPKWGDDRLAFVLAHEIAHQLKDDYWHLTFLQALKFSEEQSPENKEIYEEIEAITSSTNKVIAKELQADEYGIVYSSMAGFNANAIISEDEQVNFFREWANSIDPARIKGLQSAPTHPTPEQRAETVKARLRQIVNHVEYFELGLIYYQAGEYEKAIQAFEELLQYYPNREVNLNLGVCHHQIAVQMYERLREENGYAMPFKLSVTIDPITRAKAISLRIRGDPSALEEEFKAEINTAILYYSTAIDQDPYYPPAQKNLASALMLRSEPGDIHEAIAILERGLAQYANDKEMLNNLGVALYLNEKPLLAKEHLLKASALDSFYSAPIFNLGKFAYDQGEIETARQYWRAYLKLEPSGPWADFIRKTFSMDISSEVSRNSPAVEAEHINGLKVYDDESKAPADLKKSRSRQIDLQIALIQVIDFGHGVKTVWENNQIQLIAVNHEYNGKTVRGIAAGSSKEAILKKYGAPTNVLNLSQGEVLFYVLGHQGLAFQLWEGKVNSWLLFGVKM